MCVCDHMHRKCVSACMGINACDHKRLYVGDGDAHIHVHVYIQVNCVHIIVRGMTVHFSTLMMPSTIFILRF